jgi:tetratricopeptide (TPR) repeat protein
VATKRTRTTAPHGAAALVIHLCLAAVLAVAPAIASAQADRAEFSKLFDAGMALVAGRIDLDGLPLKAPDAAERRQLHKARSLLVQAAAIEPDNGAPLLFLAKIEERLGNAAGSTAWLQKALVVAPDNAVVGLELGGALGRQGRYREAAAAMEKSVLANPGHAALHFNYGLVLLMSGQAQRSVKAFDNALTLEPGVPLNRKVRDLAVAVSKGAKPAPKNERELAALL